MLTNPHYCYFFSKQNIGIFLNQWDRRRHTKKYIIKILDERTKPITKQKGIKLSDPFINYPASYRQSKSAPKYGNRQLSHTLDQQLVAM